MRLLTRTKWCCLLGAAALLAAGCGEKPQASVTGTVLVDGELASSGTVTLHPVGEGGVVATGRIHKDGSFVVKSGQGDRDDPDRSTIAAGEYVVTVVVNAPPKPSDTSLAGPPLPGGRLTAAKYADKSTSDLRYTIGTGAEVLSLTLEGEPISAPAEASADGAGEESEDAEEATTEGANAEEATADGEDAEAGSAPENSSEGEEDEPAPEVESPAAEAAETAPSTEENTGA
ncbi:hypothetical protein Mal64_34880 [Pseudobythopirellula maris]|uniref:Carboxypeptidase regulatory-like domain-containing protein n=1 Tax=Pseudobythopirellula maris TaxID=2527991 RepID=A0A5C5ZGW3_9BACT|nr:hypothetical protein [Pseudobythopirellula maris]TWT86659.1 hypothetical protein Mal64_34880 [Pseudobythopirellula maris]